LQQWLPDIKSVVIHARMKNETIEKNLMDFINKKYRVLISTTIIENGIDIPDVNTLVVLGADRFGLTQLYQLRGRIGRGNRQAYAYFLIHTNTLSDKARMRLEAIREFAELGSGYKLAEFDLKLRGAGSLLGNKQHGHIEALGFDYYHHLLNKTVKELKGEIEKEREPQIKIHFSYSIEPDYIQNSTERITVYRRILEAKEFDELDELQMELEDRYGRLPESMEKIFLAGMMRVLTKQCQLEEVEVYTDKVQIRFPESTSGESLVDRRVLVKFRDFDMEILDKRTSIFNFTDYREFIEQFRTICPRGGF
jgi:transcription-repair coupling factor (superfamily II helicase)